MEKGKICDVICSQVCKFKGVGCTDGYDRILNEILHRSLQIQDLSLLQTCLSMCTSDISRCLTICFHETHCCINARSDQFT